MLSPTDMSVIGAAFHNHAQEIDRAGFQPDWLESPVAQEVVSAMLSLSRQGKVVNPLNVMATARGVPKEAWGAIIEIGKNGYGDVDWRQAVSSSRESYVTRELVKIRGEMDVALRNPKFIPTQWLPSFTTKINMLMDTGKSKDANPVALFAQSIPQVKFLSMNRDLNSIMGGGYRDGMLVIYAGCTGHGKSTLLITHACDGLKQGKRVSVVVNELMPQMFFKRILRGITGLSEAEIEAKKGNDQQRHDLLTQWVAYLEERLRVYDREMYTPKWLERVVSWDQPDMLVVDYIKDTDTGQKQRGNDAPGDMAFAMLDLYRSARIPILTAGQMSDSNAKSFIKNDHAAPPIIYGSARCQQAATIYVATKRDNYLPNTQYVIKHKDSLTGQMGIEARLRYNGWYGRYLFQEENKEP